jgi:hypothetical protein
LPQLPHIRERFDDSRVPKFDFLDEPIIPILKLAINDLHSGFEIFGELDALPKLRGHMTALDGLHGKVNLSCNQASRRVLGIRKWTGFLIAKTGRRIDVATEIAVLSFASESAVRRFQDLPNQAIGGATGH